jgi:hypothetical protein
MSVYQIMVDGDLDVVVDVPEVGPWLEAAGLVADALDGGPCQVEAVYAPELEVTVDLPWFENMRTVVTDG